MMAISEPVQPPTLEKFGDDGGKGFSVPGLIRQSTYNVPDPFAPRMRPGASFLNALLATALFRCWPLLIFFGAWSTAIVLITRYVHSLAFSSTLLTVIGTVLGFVISYRTTSSFERYNEGRRYWSQIILASRTFARTLWLHVPDAIPIPENMPKKEQKARSLVEKKSVINLIEAFSVSVKHYLRGEDGIYYKDLYYLVKFLPAYALPAGIPSSQDLPAELENDLVSPMRNDNYSTSVSGGAAGAGTNRKISFSSLRHALNDPVPRRSISHNSNLLKIPSSYSAPHLPLPVTTPGSTSPPPQPANTLLKKVSSVYLSPKLPLPAPLVGSPVIVSGHGGGPSSPTSGLFRVSTRHSQPERIRLVTASAGPDGSTALTPAEEDELLFPASMPPKYHILDLFPLSLIVKYLTKRGAELKGKKAARLRAKMKNKAVSHNLPLEISLYLSSYISALQTRKSADVPTINNLLTSLNQLVDALTGLERILTTPIPFSYSIHLWVVTVIYCLLLPFQIYSTLKWLSIPATVLASFIFFGFLVAGEEIENPFGYDKNDLNLDHFTHNIICSELRAITAMDPPDPSIWAFSAENNLLFASNPVTDERVHPQEWVNRGADMMKVALLV